MDKEESRKVKKGLAFCLSAPLFLIISLITGVKWLIILTVLYVAFFIYVFGLSVIVVLGGKRNERNAE